MKRLLSLVAVGMALAMPSANATIIFNDTFESGNLSNWTTTGSSPFVISDAQNATTGGQYSALMDTSADRMHRNIIADNGGNEVTGHSWFISYIYDAGPTPTTRIFNEVRGYNGGTGLPNGGNVANGSLAQLLAIGKYNQVTMAGDVYDGTKYQARVTFGTTTGWFNLNAPGAPSRSTGWHKFAIERLADGTTVNFYVDDILSRTITGTANVSWDTIVMGPGLGSTVGNGWVDNVSVAVPEPGSVMALGVGLASMVGLIRRKKA